MPSTLRQERDIPSIDIRNEVERFLRTGDFDVHCSAWPGDVLERERRARDELHQALVAEVRRRTEGLSIPEKPQGIDVVGLTRRKVGPMVRGLFPRAEQDAAVSVKVDVA